MNSERYPYYSRSMYKGAPASSFPKARKLRLNMTMAEKKLWEKLKNKQLQNCKFRRQHPLHIYIVDFYCHELGLVIEIDGEYHKQTSQEKMDDDRSKILEFQGLTIIRFTNEQVIDAFDEVLHDIKKYLNEIKDSHSK